jgi:AcrR family transcriptional regulator
VQTFWTQGYSATTLDDLVAATGMNRPSIYNAFGDKETVYRLALEQFIGGLRAVIAERVSAEPNLAKALTQLYEGALDVYFAREPAQGCFVFCTAPAEALEHPGVRSIMRELLRELDALLAARFRDAQQVGQWSRDGDPQMAARLAQGVLHSIALRARAGESRADLARMAAASVAWLSRM